MMKKERPDAKIESAIAWGVRPLFRRTDEFETHCAVRILLVVLDFAHHRHHNANDTYRPEMPGMVEKISFAPHVVIDAQCGRTST